MVSGTRKVLNTTTTDQNNGVLLKVMSLTRDIACYFNTVGKTYSGNLSKSGVRLLRSCSLNSCAYTSLLRSRCICGFLMKGIVSFLECRSCTVVSLPFLTNWLNVGILFTSCDIDCWLLLSAFMRTKNGTYPMHAPLLYTEFFCMSRRNLKFSLKIRRFSIMTRLDELSQIYLL